MRTDKKNRGMKKRKIILEYENEERKWILKEKSEGMIKRKKG